MAERHGWVVIGGGVAGLLAARRLARAGESVTLLEASEQVGGRVISHFVDGIELDAGAESFATRGGVVAGLTQQLGLGAYVVSPASSPAWVVEPDRAYPLPAAGWLGIPVHPFDREVRRVLGWRGAVRAASDRWRPLGTVPADITIGALVRARLGDRVADALVGPVISGVYSRPIDELPLAAIAAGLPGEIERAGGLLAVVRSRTQASPAGSAVQGLRGGVARLAGAIAADAEASGATILTASAVTSVDRVAGQWQVSTANDSRCASGVVIAVPSQRVSQWNLGLAPSGERNVALVTLVLDAPELDAAPRGTGVLATGAVTRAKALTHSTAKGPWLAEAAAGRHVVRLSYSVDDPGEDVTGHALADASRLLGVELRRSQVRATAQVVWPDASPAQVGDANPQPGLHLVGSAAGLSGLAAIVAADASQTFGEHKETSQPTRQ